MSTVSSPFKMMNSDIDEAATASPVVIRYHHLIVHDQHLLAEIRLSVVIVIGSIVILACLAYIVLQCRTAAARVTKKRLKEEEEELINSHDRTERVLQPAPNTSKLKVQHEQEFYV